MRVEQYWRQARKRAQHYSNASSRRAIRTIRMKGKQSEKRWTEPWQKPPRIMTWSQSWDSLNHFPDWARIQPLVKYSDIKNLSVDNKSELFKLCEESFATGQVLQDWSQTNPQTWQGSKQAEQIPYPHNAEHHGKADGTDRVEEACSGPGTEKRTSPTKEGTEQEKKRREKAAKFVFHVYEEFQGKDQTLAMAIDLEDSHNSVQLKLLMELLVQYGVRLTPTGWLAAGLQEWKVALETGSPRPNNRKRDFHMTPPPPPPIPPWPQSSTVSAQRDWRICTAMV